jgi:hypothetical protein
MAVSGEYDTGMIRLTLTAMPRRVTALAAKAAVLTGLVLVTSTIAVLGSLLAGRLILPGHGIGPAPTATRRCPPATRSGTCSDRSVLGSRRSRGSRTATGPSRGSPL